MKLLTHYLNAIAQTHPEIINWRKNHLNDSLFYSFRSTYYDRQTYPSRLHYHDYYELIVFLEGDIQYICESAAFQPQYGDMILIPPHKLHMSVIHADATLYKRHVFYLYPDALEPYGCNELLRFLSLGEGDQYLFTLEPQSSQALHVLLARLDQALKNASEREHALARGLVIEIFYWLSEASIKPAVTSSRLPENVRSIQRYIDEHFFEIGSVAEVASHFFYSREYVSRLFRHHFGITVADYITQRRIARSQILIAQGVPLSDVCFQVGFGSLATFIRVFKAMTHMTPSQYRNYTLKGGKE